MDTMQTKRFHYEAKETRFRIRGMKESYNFMDIPQCHRTVGRIANFI